MFKKSLFLALCITWVGVLFFGAVTPARAEIIVVHENFTNDMSGNVGNVNLYWPPYGTHTRNAGGYLTSATARVPLNVPTAAPGKPVFVEKLAVEWHDHDESIGYLIDIVANGQTTTSILGGRRGVDTKGQSPLRTDAVCGSDRLPGEAFIKLIADHHLQPDAINDDRTCYSYLEIPINQPIEQVILRFECDSSGCQKSWDEHVHIRGMAWYIEKTPQVEPIPDPQVEVLGCVIPNASQQPSDLVRFTWGDPTQKITTVNISDSPAANRWQSPAGKYWAKQTGGATSVVGPAGFTAQTPNASNPLIFKSGVTYSVVLWNGTNLSTVKDFSFQACAQQPQPATATVTSACVQRQSGQPLAYTLQLKDVDTKGAIFNRASLYIDMEVTSVQSALQNFLGTPSWSDWEINNRAPRIGDKYGYTLANFLFSNPTNIYPITWSSNTMIGDMRGNQRTLADLEAWIKAQNTFQLVKVSGLIQSSIGSNLITTKPTGSVTLQISDTACVQTPVCVPNCNTCSLPNSSDGCGGFCPMGDERGAPNKVKILQPAPGDSLAVNNNSVVLMWQQDPTNNESARYVDNYQVVMYPSSKYATITAALQAFQNKANDVLFFYKAAAQGNPAAIYAHQVTLPQALLAGGPVTIGIRSLNLTCPGSSETLGNPNNPVIPTPPPWEETPPVPLEAAFAGKFFKSDSCNVATAEPIALSSSSFVTVQYLGNVPNQSIPNLQEYSANATGDSYSIGIPPIVGADYTPRLKFDQVGQSETLACSSCNPTDSNGFCVRPRTTGPTNTAHFFVESYDLRFASWWQARGGLVYGHTGIRSLLPLNPNSPVPNDDCVTAGDYCKPFLVRKTMDEADLSAGIPVTTGLFTSVDNWWTERADEAHANSGVDLKSHVRIENYAFFMSQLDETPNADITKNISSLGDIPAGREERGARVSYSNGDLTFNPDQTWVISSGEKRVIFVNGNLRFSQIPEKMISVQPGGFLAFIVSGNITFDPTVGHTSISDTQANTSLEPNVEGVFISNGAITIESAGSDDKKFVGAGSFVGWGGVNLPRNFEKDTFGRVRNNTTPTETFTYRPDFLTNAPELIKATTTNWREVN